jgi:hypothetical protein
MLTFLLRDLSLSPFQLFVIFYTRASDALPPVLFARSHELASSPQDHDCPAYPLAGRDEIVFVLLTLQTFVPHGMTAADAMGNASRRRLLALR